jgi:hypothetical protein
MWTGGAAEGGAAANGGAASAAQQQARLELALNSNEFGEDEYVQVCSDCTCRLHVQSARIECKRCLVKSQRLAVRAKRNTQSMNQQDVPADVTINSIEFRKARVCPGTRYSTLQLQGDLPALALFAYGVRR